MKSNVVLPLIAIVTLYSEPIIAETRQCICVNYDECNSDFSPKGTSSNYHELQTFEAGTQRPTCTNAIDVCCDLNNDKNANTNNYFHNTSTTAKPTTKKWSCGYSSRNIDSNNFESNVETARGEFPWTVAVLRKDTRDSPTFFHCEGTLIHENAVLTSAKEVHNLRARDLIVRAGAHNWQSKSGAQDLKINSIEIHPNFDPESYVNNYALLILNEKAKANSNVNSICLPSSRNDYEPLECIETGWGEDRAEINQRGSGALKKSGLSLIDHEICENIFIRTYNGDYMLDKTVLCAGDDDFACPCTGEGGSPIICRLKRNRRRYVQTGISSIAVCREPRKPGLYADISEGVAWINRFMKSRGFDTDFYSSK